MTSDPYEMRFSTEDSIAMPLFRTDLEKLVRPGVDMPAEDGMRALSLSLQRKWNFLEEWKQRTSCGGLCIGLDGDE